MKEVYNNFARFTWTVTCFETLDACFVIRDTPYRTYCLAPQFQVVLAFGRQDSTRSFGPKVFRERGWPSRTVHGPSQGKVEDWN
jgi:hypothetical protein